MEFADEAVWLLSAIYYLLNLRPMSMVDWGDGIMYRRGPSSIVVASAPLPKNISDLSEIVRFHSSRQKIFRIYENLVDSYT